MSGQSDGEARQCESPETGDAWISLVSGKLGENAPVVGTVTSLGRSDHVWQLPYAHRRALCLLQGLVSPSEGAEWDLQAPVLVLWDAEQGAEKAASFVWPGTHIHYLFGFHCE